MVFLGEITNAGLHLSCGLCARATDIIEHKDIVPFMLYVMRNEPYGPLCFDCEGIQADLVPKALTGSFSVLIDGKFTCLLV